MSSQIYPGSYPSDSGPAEPPSSGKAITSLVLGICSLFLWLCPLAGLPVSIIGLVMGIQGVRQRSSGMAIAGIILSAIGLLATLVNAAIGAYLGATGQLFPPAPDGA